MSETLIYIMIIAFNCLAASGRNIRQSYTTRDRQKLEKQNGHFYRSDRYLFREIFPEGPINNLKTRWEYFLIGGVMQSISKLPQMMILFEWANN